MKLVSRFSAALLGGLAVFGAAVSAQTKAAGPAAAEHVLLQAANRERAARHLPALLWDENLAQAAREHALLMARMGSLSHQFPGEHGLSERVARAGVQFTLVAENVGTAGSAAELHDLWMKSPAHRANLLEPKEDAIGIAVVERGELIFAVEDFARVVVNVSLSEQERRVSALLETRGLRVLPTTSNIRKTCSLSSGVAPGLHPKFLFRYLTADISTLPVELEDELARHHDEYSSAAVGACSSSPREGFEGYRLAVLLY